MNQKEIKKDKELLKNARKIDIVDFDNAIVYYKFFLNNVKTWKFGLVHTNKLLKVKDIIIFLLEESGLKDFTEEDLLTQARNKGFSIKVYENYQKDNVKEILDYNTPLLKLDYFVQILPHGYWTNLGLATTSGAVVGGTAGSVFPVVGNVIGAAAGAVLGAATFAVVDFFVSKNQQEIQAGIDKQQDKLNLFNSIPQAIKIKPYKKIESRQLRTTLVDNRIDGGDVIPQMFGRLRVVPAAISAFKKIRTRRVGTSRNYQDETTYSGIFSYGEGPMDVTNNLLSGKTFSRFKNTGDFDNVLKTGLGVASPTITRGAITPITSTDYFNTNFPSVPSAGLKLENQNNYDIGSISIVITRSSINATHDNRLDQYNQFTKINLLWFLLFWDIKESFSTQQEASDAILAGTYNNVIIEIIPALSLVTNDSTLFYHLVTPTNKLPIYLMEEFLQPGDPLNDDIIEGLILENKKPNARYTIRHISAAETISRSTGDTSVLPDREDAFNFNFNVSITGYKLYRLSYDDIKNLIVDIDSINPLPSGSDEIQAATTQPRRIQSLLKINYLSSSHNMITSIVNQNDQEAQNILTKKFLQDRPPQRPTIETIDDTIRRFRYTTQNLVTTDGSRFTFRYISERSIEDIYDLIRAVSRWNENITFDQGFYNSLVRRYREDVAEFDERFNYFTSSIREFSSLCTRYILDYLPITEAEINSETFSKDYTKNNSDNPAVICVYVISIFLKRIKENIELEDLIDIEAFKDWKIICEEQNLKFNASFDFETTIFDTINQIAFVGFAELDYSFGKIRPIVNKRRSVIQQYFNSNNLNNFRFSYTRINPPDSLIGTYVNQDKNYQPDESKIYLNGTNESTVRSEKIISYFGVTSETIIKKHLDYLRRKLINKTRVYSFTTDVQALAVRRGDLVAINHYELSSSSFSSVVVNIITNSDDLAIGVQIETKNTPQLKNNQLYECQILTDDVTVFIDVTEIKKTQVKGTINDITDRTNQQIQTRSGLNLAIRPVHRTSIIFDEPIENNISIGNPILFGIKNKVIQKCLVDTLKINKSMSVEVTLSGYDDNLFLF